MHRINRDVGIKILSRHDRPVLHGVALRERDALAVAGQRRHNAAHPPGRILSRLRQLDKLVHGAVLPDAKPHIAAPRHEIVLIAALRRKEVPARGGLGQQRHLLARRQNIQQIAALAVVADHTGAVKQSVIHARHREVARRRHQHGAHDAVLLHAGQHPAGGHAASPVYHGQIVPVNHGVANAGVLGANHLIDNGILRHLGRNLRAVGVPQPELIGNIAKLRGKLRGVNARLKPGGRRQRQQHAALRGGVGKQHPHRFFRHRKPRRRRQQQLAAVCLEQAELPVLHAKPQRKPLLLRGKAAQGVPGHLCHAAPRAALLRHSLHQAGLACRLQVPVGKAQAVVRQAFFNGGVGGGLIPIAGELYGDIARITLHQAAFRANKHG